MLKLKQQKQNDTATYINIKNLYPCEKLQRLDIVQTEYLINKIEILVEIYLIYYNLKY